MEKFVTFSGIAMPLQRSDVDTDQIIPAQFMKRVSKSGYEDALFHSWRQDAEFLLNRDIYADAEILVAGRNFGTGSSREHAVWALRDYGFRAVLSPRFADIFRGNAGKQGLLAAELDVEAIEAIWRELEASPTHPMKIDLEARTVSISDASWAFRVDDSTRERLLAGLDDIEITLRSEAAISEFETSRPGWMPTTLPERT